MSNQSSPTTCLFALIALCLTASSSVLADLKQTAGDYTISLPKAEWAIPPQLASTVFHKGLWVHYRVTSSDGFPADIGSNPQQFLQARIYSPSRLDINVTTTFVGDGIFANVDPNDSSYRVDFILTDPTANPSDIGYASGHALFAQVTLPTGYGQTSTVNRRYTTEMGTTLTLKSIRLDAPDISNQNMGRTRMAIQVEPSPSEHGFSFSLGGEPIRLTYGNGKTWTAYFFGPWNDPTSTIDAILMGIPPDRSSPSDISVPITESALAIRDPAKYMHFAFRIPASTITSLAPLPVARNISTETVGPVSVSLEAIHGYDQRYVEYPIWITDSAAEHSVDWQITSAQAHMSAGSVMAIDRRYLPYWRMDGHLPPARSFGSVYGVWSGANPPESTISVHLSVEPWSRSESEYTFSNVQIPAPGKTITLNRLSDDNTSPALTLVSVNNSLPPSMWGGGWRTGLIYTFHPSDALASNLQLYNIQAIDDKGLCLLPNPTAYNRVRQTMPSGLEFLVYPSSKGASTITIVMHAIQTAPTGSPLVVDLPVTR